MSLMSFLTFIGGSMIMIFLPYIFNFIGLSSIGPTAGGLFSTFQGSGIVSGSVMAIAQSFAMSGWVIVLQTSNVIFWCIAAIISLVKIKINRS